MVFGKIVVKNDYEKKGDLVFRPLFRMYKKMGIYFNDNENETQLLGIVVNDSFYELSTWKKIEDANYEIISSEEFNSLLNCISIDNLKKLRKMINYIIFREFSNSDFDISSIEDLACDRNIEFNAYDKSLSSINPYSEPLNGYNDFIYKCKVLKEDNHGRKV